MTNPPVTPPSPRTGTRLLRARAGWFVGTTLLVLAAAAVFTWLQPRVYESTADVVVLAVVTPDNPTPSTPSMGTEKDLVLSDVVASAAANQLGIPLDRLVGAATVTVPPQTQTLEITCAMGDPQLASRCAQALGQAYVDYKDSQPIQAPPQRGRIITPSTVPTSPTLPNIPLNLVAGLLVGLLVGFLVALLRDRLDTRCRRAEDVEGRGLRVLGVVPPVRNDAPGSEQGSADGGSGNPEETQAYASFGACLRQLALWTPGAERARLSPGAVVCLTPVDTDGVRSTRAVAAGLASALSADGERVVLVHADPARARHDGPAGPAGLLDVLAGRSDLDATLAETAHPHLTRLPLGDPSPSRARIALREWSRMVEVLAARFDVVVVVADPLLATPNGLSVAQGASTVLAVVDAASTTRAAVDRLRSECEHLTLPLVGCVLVLERRPGRRGFRPAADVPRSGPTPSTAGGGWGPETVNYGGPIETPTVPSTTAPEPSTTAPEASTTEPERSGAIPQDTTPSPSTPARQATVSMRRLSPS